MISAGLSAFAGRTVLLVDDAPERGKEPNRVARRHVDAAARVAGQALRSVDREGRRRRQRTPRGRLRSRHRAVRRAGRARCRISPATPGRDGAGEDRGAAEEGQARETARLAAESLLAARLSPRVRYVFDTFMDAVVNDAPCLDVSLLGMSFLNRTEMKREGDTMSLMRRF